MRQTIALLVEYATGAGLRMTFGYLLLVLECHSNNALSDKELQVVAIVRKICSTAMATHPALPLTTVRKKERKKE